MANEMLSNWYFVVYFRSVKKNVILPAKWIENIGDHTEKFFNYGLNTSQRYLCFYTNNPDAFDEKNCPRADWPANFNLAMRSDFKFDGCFRGKLKKAMSK